MDLSELALYSPELLEIFEEYEHYNNNDIVGTIILFIS